MADSITPHVDTKTPDGVERLVGQMIDEAEAYISRQVRQDRIDASDVYKGRPYGNEEEGRSQVVLKIVRRVVARIMPSLMRIFTGPERYVEFKPRGPNGEEKAKQATDYVNYLVTEDNPGYSIIQAALKDALVRRVGVIKWGSEVKAIPETARYTGLSETELLSLWLDDDVTVEDIQPEEDEKGEYDEVPPTETNEQGETEPAGETAEPAEAPGAPAPAGMQAAQPAAPVGQPPTPASATKTFSALVTKGHTERRVWIRECPGEEILWDRDARDFESARIVDHVRFDMPVYELEAMGWDYEKDLIDNVGMGPMNLAANTAMMESDSRRNDMGILRTELLQDPHTRPIRYDEAYVRINYKNKGVKLHKVCMVGVAHHILGEPEPVSHVPFCRLTPDPEPHTLEGTSITDDVGPIQKIETQIARGVLDSLALTLSPALLIQDGEVNVKDLLNTEVGRFVRTTNPQTAVQELTHSFVGKEALPVMAYFDHEVENVTGQSDASQGLDADVLQSTTKLAVAGTFKAAQEQTEMIARTFAEQLKVLYKGLLRTIIENNDGPRIVRLRGKYIEIDPRAWDADMDVIVNVGLGQGLVEDRMNLLIQVAAKQEQIMATLGPNNPLVKLSQYRNTLARIIEMAGFKNAAEFFSEIDPQQEQAAEQAAAQAPQSKDPNAALAQAEVQKAQIAAQADGQRAQLASQDKAAERSITAFKVQHDAEMDRMRLAADIALKTREIEMKHGGAIDREQLRAEVEKEKALLDAKTKLIVESMKSEVARAGHASQEAVAAHAAGASVATAAIAQQGAVQKAIMQREARTIGTNVQKEANGPMTGEGA